MATETTCPRCNKVLPTTAPDGLCPECLMQVALESNTMDAPTFAPVTKPNEFDVTVSRSGPISLQSDDVLPAGSRLGSFMLERKLGEGGMGTVYEAIDEDTGRRVALKVLKHRLNTPEARKRFLREGQTAASINHSNCVYVFGTDNIDDKLVIAMELVGSGNLQDVIKRNGSLTSRQAVDTILQIIDGLESAAEVGVLHRDVKPANCFVDETGAVKVGDFGLSISTIGDEEAFTSDEDTFLGTPAFASPEQLRGDDLDVRSDIYSVGVTLYQLATGELPFTANNMVELISKVMETPAPMANSIQPRIPVDLSKAIARCLAKNPDERFKTYAELRDAIASFSSQAPEPASLPIRVAAGIVDSFTLSIAMTVTGLFVLPSFWVHAVTNSLVSLAIPLFYYLFFEGLFARSLGKWVFRLQVIDGERQKPALMPVLIRTLSSVLIPSSVYTLYTIFSPAETDEGVLSNILSLTPLLIHLCMFSRARRRNGYAALHDWLSDTRVIQCPPQAFDISLSTETQTGPLDEVKKPEDSGLQIGPYHVLRQYGKSDGAANVLAYDRRLLRKVWIRTGGHTKEVSQKRRELNRQGRQRWLNSSREDEAGWDAWENVEGSPLIQLIRQRQPWSRVRVWLFDLAHELAMAQHDGTAPEEISLGNVWISTNGHAKLLDFPAPYVTEKTESQDAECTTVYKLADEGTTQAFLLDVAQRSVQGSSKRYQPLPTHALNILHSLKNAEPLEDIAKELHRVREKPVAVSRLKRWGMFGAAIAIPAGLGSVVLGLGMFWQLLQQQMPLMQVFPYAALSDNAEPHAERSKIDISNTAQLRQFIADEFGDFVRDPEKWNSNEVIRALNQQKRVRETAERIVKHYSDATPEEIAKGRELFGHLLMQQPKSMPENEAIAANLATCVSVAVQHDRSPRGKLRQLKIYVADQFSDQILDEKNWDSFVGKKLMKDHHRKRLERYIREGSNAPQWEIDMAREELQVIGGAISHIGPYWSGYSAARLFLLMIALPAAVGGIFFRGGLLMWIFQLDCVTSEGEPAERALMFVRAIVWSAPAILLMFGFWMLIDDSRSMLAIGIIFVSCLIPLWSLVMMRRSLLDQLLGTHLVPR